MDLRIYHSPFIHIVDTSAWTAGQNDLAQYIEIDLGRQFNISAIGTQGRQHTLEFVQEFKLESGIDGHDYNIYRDRNGNIKVLIHFSYDIICQSNMTNMISTNIL